MANLVLTITASVSDRTLDLGDGFEAVVRTAAASSTGTYADGTVWIEADGNNKVVWLSGIPTDTAGGSITNGAMHNPGFSGLQGYDNQYIGPNHADVLAYDDALNIHPGKGGSNTPRTLGTGTVIMARSRADTRFSVSKYRSFVIVPNGQRPAANALPPVCNDPACTVVKTTADIDISTLPSLDPAPLSATVDPAPALATIIASGPEATLAYPNGADTRNIMPAGDGFGSFRTGDHHIPAMAALCYSTTTAQQKLDIATHIVAKAIQIKAALDSSPTYKWDGLGGVNQWMDPLLLMGAALTNDTSWISLYKQRRTGFADQCYVVTEQNAAYDTHIYESSTGRTSRLFDRSSVGVAAWARQPSVNPEMNGGELLGEYGRNYSRHAATYFGVCWIVRQMGFTSAMPPGMNDLIDAWHLDHRGGNDGWAERATVNFLDALMSEYNTPITSGAPAVASAVTDLQPQDYLLTWPTGVAITTGEPLRHKLNLTFNKPVRYSNDQSNQPATGDFTVNVNGSPVTIHSLFMHYHGLSLLTVGEIQHGDTVTVSHTPGVNPITGHDGTTMAGFANLAVQNDVPDRTGISTTLPVGMTCSRIVANGVSEDFNALALSGQTMAQFANGDTAGEVRLAGGDSPQHISMPLGYGSGSQSGRLNFNFSGMTIGVSYKVRVRFTSGNGGTLRLDGIDTGVSLNVPSPGATYPAWAEATFTAVAASDTWQPRDYLSGPATFDAIELVPA